MHCDGGNLYLRITQGAEGKRRLAWIFRFALAGRGRARDMGLGSVDDVSLVEARERARVCRDLVREGVDPIEHRAARVAENLAATARAMTFDEAAASYIRQHRAGWGNLVHAQQWQRTIETYASPLLGKLPVAAVTTQHVMRVLAPIWTDKVETASRLRGRIELVLDFAKAAGHRDGENPARWRGHLDKLLPARARLRKPVPQRALAYGAMPGFMAELRERGGFGSLALQFTILTAVRTADVLNAKREHVDLKSKTWTIPSFSKVGKQHRVALSGPAIAVVEQAITMAATIGGSVAASPYLFVNDATGARMSPGAMARVLDRMNRTDETSVHGFRSAFRTWLGEETTYAWELGELALGHRVGSRVELAYARGDGLERRRAVMEDWASFVGGSREPDSGMVIPIRSRGA
jgi:integrase